MASKMNNKRLDKVFQKKVDHVQEHNGIHVFWDKEGVWKRIQKALKEGSPKMIVWYATMAASVSILVASTVNIVSTDFILLEDEEEIIESIEAKPLTLKRNNPSSKPFFIALPADSMIIPLKSRQVQALSGNKRFSLNEQLPEVREKLKAMAGVYESKPAQVAQKVRVMVSPGISANRSFIMPKLDLGLAFNVSKNPELKKKVFVGGSVQLMQTINAEQREFDRSSAGYFLKTSYSNEKNKGGKTRSWSTGVEYLIHSENNQIPENMIKVYYNRSVMGRLKVGPELMIIRNFKRIYPGISLAIG